MCHAGRGVAGCVDGKRLQGSDLVAVALGKQAVELRSVALKFGAFVENLAKGILHKGDVFTDADLAAQLSLNIGGTRQMVGMNVGFNQPFQRQTMRCDEFNHCIGRGIGNATRRVIDIHHAVDHRTGGTGGITHHIAHGVGFGVKESGDLGPDRQVDGGLDRRVVGHVGSSAAT